ncbi:MAG: SusC/RagA family TonB-linked outer membrane protein [Bacteroidetes bacterium]|nr:SusC/RagA family TonB-linked outer membrane protein [Bacteroidota bacterium]
MMSKSHLYSRVLVLVPVMLLCSLVGAMAQSERRPLIDVLIELNKVRGVYFLFSRQPLAKVPVNAPQLSSTIPVEKVLTQVLKNTGLYFKKVDDRTFVILDRKGPDVTHSDFDTAGGQAFADASPALPPPTIHYTTGRVWSSDGKPLQGVSVTQPDDRKGTVTDLDGAFRIAAEKNDSLLFSFVGYKTKTLPAAEIGQQPIVLDPSGQPLTEVLVTALGIRKEHRSMGYSVEELNGASLTQSREINLGRALVGQVAGLSVTMNATGPYGSSRVLIRGNASLSGNNQPLYVVDGVPYDNTTQAWAGQYGGVDLGDGLSNINPDDISSVLVLKGVAASALYGYRGGNGAILITTRSGLKTRGIGIQVNNNFTVNQVIDTRDYQYVYGQGVAGAKPVNAQMALAAPYYSWGARLDGTKAVNYLGDSYAYQPAKNNFQHFFQTGLTNQSSVALTGSNAKGQFRLGLSNLTLQSIVPNSYLQQPGITLNTTYNVTNRLQATLTANYVFERVNNRATLSDNPGNVISAPMYLANSFDIRWMKENRIHPDGTEWLPGNTDPYFENPYYIAYDYLNTTNRNRFTGGLTLKYDILPWLYAQGQVTRDGYTLDVNNIVPSGVPYTRGDGIHGGNLTQYNIDFHELNTSFMTGVRKSWPSELSFNAYLGVNRQDNVTNISGIGAVPNSANRAAGPFVVAGNYTANNILVKPYSTSTRRYRVNSVYANVDLGYKDYLFLSLTARSDWFSTLSINTNQYLYPSVSGSFLFSSAWHLPSWISLGRLRASWAESSNGTEPYLNTLSYGIRSYSVSGQGLGYIATSDAQPLIPNPNLRPISIREKEAGVQLQFLQDRIGVDFTYYNKQTTDDIVRLTVSPTSGYDQAIRNVGRIRNQGIELLLKGTPIKSPDFSWNTALNLSLNDNKVLYIGGDQSVVIGGAYPRWGSEVSISNVVGLPYGQIMGFAYKRDEKGNKVFSDGINNPAPAGEPVPTAVVPLGSTLYKQTGGFSNDFYYKDFTLSMLIDFKFGAKIYSGTNLLLYYYGLHKTTLQGREGGFIGKGVSSGGHPNTIAVPAQQYFQDISAGGTDHIAEEFVYDASFIKWRSLSLAYSFPQTLFRKTPVKGLTVSLVGRNLATLLKHTPNIDPESSINNTNGQGLELTGYPPVRSLGLNVNCKF